VEAGGIHVLALAGPCTDYPSNIRLPAGDNFNLEVPAEIACSIYDAGGRSSTARVVCVR
jgi:hypothetical protein